MRLWCNACDKWLGNKMFHKSTTNYTGRQSRCKKCVKNKTPHSGAWDEKRTEQFREHVSEVQSKPRKWKKGSDLKSALRREQLRASAQEYLRHAD